MTAQITITLEDGHIKVLSDGEKSYQFATKLWTEIRDTCQRTQCFSILGVARTTVPMETHAALEMADLFENLGIDDRFRIAWVELNPEAYRAVYFVESVLSNHGLPGRVFLEIEEAKEWLLSRPANESRLRVG